MKPVSKLSEDRIGEDRVKTSADQSFGLLVLLLGSGCLLLSNVWFENVSQIAEAIFLGFPLAYLLVRNLAPSKLIGKVIGLVGLITLLFLLKVDSIQAIATIWRVIGSAFLFVGLYLSITKSTRKDPKFSHIKTLVKTSGELEISLTSESIQRWINLVLIVMAAFFWTIEELAPGIKQIVVVAIAVTGIANYGQWCLQFEPKFRILILSFDGLNSHSYLFKLPEFGFLEKITLEEGELSWIQLSGARGDVTLPLCLFSEPEVSQSLYEKLLSITKLAKQEGVRDRLRLIGILLPLGAGTFAGICLIIGAIILIWLVPQEIPQKAEGLSLLIGICLVSPKVARSLLGWLAPRISSPLPNPNSVQLQAWEVGAAIVITILGWGLKQWGIGEVLTLTAEWLMLAIGINLLVLMRRTPIISR